MSTSEFSFILKPSPIHGVGVFAVHDIKAGEFLRLFGDDKHPEENRMLKKEDVPEIFRQYCLDRGGELACPDDFGCMPIGWYLNHSRVPNAEFRGWECFALRDIASGEEIVIDYNNLEEPESAKEKYY